MTETRNHRSVAVNSVFNFISQAIAATFTFVSSIYLARMVGPYTMGQYSYLIWAITTFATLGSLGIPMAMTKYIAQYSEDEDSSISKQIAGNWLLISLGLSIVMAVVLCVLAKSGVLATHGVTSYFYLISLALPLNLSASAMSSIFSGHRRYSSIMQIGIISSPLSFFILVVALHRSHSLYSILIAYLLGSGAIFCVTLFFARKQRFVSFAKLPKPIMQTVVKYVVMVSGILLLDKIVWDRSEVLFLGHYSSPQQVAYYSLSYTFTTNIMTLLPGSITGALMPHISSLKTNRQLIIESYQSASKYVGIIVGILVGGGIALASPFVELMFGREYSPMVPIFRVLFLSAGWAIITGVGAIVLYGMAKQSYFLKIGLFFSPINILADFLVIPSHGAMGAVIANGGTQLLAGITTIYVVTKHGGLPFPVRDYLKIFGITITSCAAVLTVVSHIGGQYILTFVFGGVAFISIFVCLALFTRLLELKEIAMLSRAVINN